MKAFIRIAKQNNLESRDGSCSDLTFSPPFPFRYVHCNDVFFTVSALTSKLHLFHEIVLKDTIKESAPFYLTVAYDFLWDHKLLDSCLKFYLINVSDANFATMVLMNDLISS